MAENTEKKVEETKEETAPKEEQQTKEEKIPLRKRIGARLMSDEPIVSKKVKRVAAIVGGGLITAGAAIGGVLIKQHMDAGAEDEPVGLLPEGAAPFEVTDFEVETVDQA